MSLELGKKQKKAFKEKYEEPKNINASRRAALARIAKAHGSEVLGVVRNKEFIRSNSIRLNWIMGGGWCLGRIYEISGRYSSGKTTLSFDAIACAQRKYPDKHCFFMDIEETFDPTWAVKFGVDLSRLDVLHPANAQLAFDEAVELCNSGAYSMGVFDSIAAMILAEEVMTDTASGKDRMGLFAAVVSAGLKRCVKAAADSRTCLILLNQLRDTLAMYGPKTSTPGGNAMKHYCSCRIQVSVKSNSEVKDGDDVVGHTIKLYVEKNKLGFPKRSTEMRLSFVKAFDTVSELRQLAIENEIITRKKGVYWFGGKQVAEEVKDLNKLLRKDMKFRDKIYELVDNAVMKEHQITPNKEFEQIAKGAPDRAEDKDEIEVVPEKDLQLLGEDDL